MRFFTALVACALAMGACSQAAIEPALENSDLTRGGNGSHIGFKKVVKNAEGEFRPAAEGEFAFELWGVQKSNGKKAPKIDFFGTFTTDANGEVWVNFPEIKGGGRDSYYFREVFETPDEEAKWQVLGDLLLTVKPSWGAVWDEYGDFDFNDGPTIVNIPVPEEIEEPERKITRDYDSVTATNSDQVGELVLSEQNNHFTYAVLTREELAEGVTLSMVNGRWFDLRGEAFVKLENDIITITIDGKGKCGAAAFNYYPGKPAHTGLDHKEMDGIEMNLECPEGDIIYLYVHCDPLAFYYNE